METDVRSEERRPPNSNTGPTEAEQRNIDDLELGAGWHRDIRAAPWIPEREVKQHAPV